MEMVRDSSPVAPGEHQLPGAEHRVVLVGAGHEARRLADDLRHYGCPVTSSPPRVIPELPEGEVYGVILGPGLPPLRVAGLCRHIRENGQVPIVALLDEPSGDHLSMVLDAGADHCFGETGGSEGRLVLSALSAVWRRRERDLEERSRIVEAGHLRIDRERRVATLRGSPLALTATEFDIVTLLTERAGELLSASEILRAVHGQDYEPAEARDIVKVHMSRLRQKLEADPVASRCIVNVRGQGYKYVFDRRHAHGTGAVPQLATV